MKIQKVNITNFRTLLDSSISLDDFAIFVGQNNHGKTNLFEALRWFFNGFSRGESADDLSHRNHKQDEIIIDVTFEGAQQGLGAMLAENNKNRIASLLDGSDEVTIRRRSNDPKKRFFIINGEEKVSPTGMDTAVNDFLPKFEYIHTRTYHDDYVKYGKNSPIATMLSGVLEKLLENDPNYQEFKQKFDDLFGSDTSQIRAELNTLSNKVKVYLEKQFPECTKVEFEVSNPAFDDLLKNFNTSIDDGVMTSVDEKGDGLQRAVMLAILQTFAEYRKVNEDNGKNFIYVIDEAELHLHPSAQRKLKHALLDLSGAGDQVLISTHSSVLISDEQEKQTIYSVEKIDHCTNITPVESSQKGDIIFNLLGGSPSDILLPNNFLIVEGHSDHRFINSIVQRFYSDKPGIQIVAANGDYNKQTKSFDAINAAYVPIGVVTPVYKEKAVILHDQVSQDRQVNFDSFKQSYPYLETNNQLFGLPTGSIEEYYPASWKKTSTQVSNMTYDEKQTLAKEVGAAIEKQVFEQEMSVVMQALTAVWEKSYGTA